MDSVIYQMFNLDITQLANFINMGFRWLGWQIVTLLAEICNKIESGVHDIYTINNFFNSKYVTDFIDRYKPIFWALMGLAFAILFLKIIVNRQENKSQIPINVIFSISVLLLLPVIMTKLGDISNNFYNDVSGISVSQDNKTTSANSLIKNNLWDLDYVDKTLSEKGKVDLSKLKEKNTISDNDILNIDINQKFDDDSAKTKDVFDKKVVNKDGKNKIVDLDKGWFQIDDAYYKYNLSFTLTIIALCTTTFTLLFVMIRIARILFDLAFNKIFASFIALFDIADGKRLRAVLKNIIALFLILMITAVTLKLYIMFNAWLVSQGVNDILKIIVLIGVSYGVIDGPNIVEQVLGEDAGVKHGMNTLLGLYGATKGASEVAKGLKGLASGVGKVGTNALSIGAMGAGAIKGKGDVGKNLQDEMKNKESENKNLEASNNLNNNLKDEMKQEDNNKNLDKFNKDNPTLKDEMKDKSTLEDKINQGKVNNPTLEQDMKDNMLDNLDKNNLSTDGTTLEEDMRNNDLGSNIGGGSTTTLEEDMRNNDLGSNIGGSSTTLNGNLNNTGDNILKANKISSNSSSGGNSQANINIETRTVGQYMKDKVNSKNIVRKINHSYTLGQNSREKWDINRANKKNNIKKK